MTLKTYISKWLKMSEVAEIDNLIYHNRVKKNTPIIVSYFVKNKSAEKCIFYGHMLDADEKEVSGTYWSVEIPAGITYPASFKLPAGFSESFDGKIQIGHFVPSEGNYPHMIIKTIWRDPAHPDNGDEYQLCMAMKNLGNDGTIWWKIYKDGIVIHESVNVEAKEGWTGGSMIDDTYDSEAQIIIEVGHYEDEEQIVDDSTKYLMDHMTDEKKITISIIEHGELLVSDIIYPRKVEKHQLFQIAYDCTNTGETDKCYGQILVNDNLVGETRWDETIEKGFTRPCIATIQGIGEHTEFIIDVGYSTS